MGDAGGDEDLAGFEGLDELGFDGAGLGEVAGVGLEDEGFELGLRDMRPDRSFFAVGLQLPVALRATLSAAGPQLSTLVEDELGDFGALLRGSGV